MKKWRKLMLSFMAASMVFTALNAGGGKEAAAPASKEAAGSGSSPIKISLYYMDNATLPFKEDWLTVKEAAKRGNAELKFEIIPIADYTTKVSLALNTQNNAPDVILYQSTRGENGALALNGAIVPISDYANWTPNFTKMVKKFNAEADINTVRLKDGKYYFLPRLFDIPFYDGGLIMREDFLKKHNLKNPKTFDDLYAILKKYKEENPSSYPLTILAGYRVLARMIMPSWGISLGKNSSSATHTLSWDYKKQVYFPGAVSEEYKNYMRYIVKLYSEGLLDPEMADPIDGDKWAQKLATGKAMASYAYYDQIGGVTNMSKIADFKLQMYPALAGPAGAHHQPKNRIGVGIMFPSKTAKRPDFERLVRTIDEIFFSEENSKMWCIGIEGTTYTEKNGEITYSDEIKKAPEGIYKAMQLKYGCGADPTQMIWINAREMTKYDANYARINAEVRAMGDVIQPAPPAPLFDDLQAEKAGLLQTPLADAYERWSNLFMTGAKSLDKDWNAYVAEMKKLGIDDFCKIYNDNMKK